MRSTFLSIVLFSCLGLACDGCGGSKHNGGGFVPITGGGLVVATSTIPDGVVGVTYSQQLQATGGTAPLGSWTVASGSLPSGVGLTSSGRLTGTPTAAGTYTFNVRVTDSGSPQQNAQGQLVLNVQQNLAVPAFATKTGMTNLAFTDSGLLDGSSQPISAGSANQSFSVVALMGTSSTIKAGDRYWAQISYTCGQMPDAKLGLLASPPVSGGSSSAQNFPQGGVVAGTGVFEVFLEVQDVKDQNQNSTTTKVLRVNMSPNTGGGGSVYRALTLN